LLADWRGSAIAWLALVAMANVYMSLFSRLRVEIESERLDNEEKEQEQTATVL
jgi:hypothetical protein